MLSPANIRSRTLFWSEYWWLTPVFLMLCTSYFFPLQYDNNTYQTMGWQLVAFGKLPYLQTWDQNFPAIVYIHALAITLFGNNTIGFRTLDIILQLGSITLLYHFTRQYFGRTVAVHAALLFTALYLFYGQSTLGQRDLYAAPMILASLFAILKCIGKNERSYLSLLSGVCLGIAILFRPTYVICVIPYFYLLIRGQSSWKRDIALFTVGALLLGLAGFAPYLSLTAIEQVYLATVRFNLDVYGSSDFYFPLSTGLVVPIEWLFTPLFAIASWWVLKKRTFGPFRDDMPRAVLTLLVLILFFKLAIYWMGKYFMYQYGPILYLGSPIMAASIVLLFERFRVKLWARVSLVAVALLFLTFRRSPAEVLLEPWDTFDRAIYEINARYKASNWNTYQDILDVTQYIRATTSPNDKIETCSWDNQIIWRTEREQSSRFTLIHPIGMKPSSGYTAYQNAWRNELALTIAKRIPKLVLLASKPYKVTGFLKQRPDDLLLGIPGFKHALESNYAYDTTIACWALYRRKD